MEEDELVLPKPITVEFYYENARGEEIERVVDITSIESGISCDNNGNDIENIAVCFTGFCHVRQAERTFNPESITTDMLITHSGNSIPQKLLASGLLPVVDFVELLEYPPEKPKVKQPTKFTLSTADNERLKSHSFFGDTQQPKPKKPKKTSTENTSSEPTKTQAVLFLLCIILAFFGAWDAIFMIVAFAVWFYSGIAFWRKASRKGKGFFIKCIHSFGGGFLAYLAVLLVGIFAGVIDTKPQEQNTHESAVEDTNKEYPSN